MFDFFKKKILKEHMKLMAQNHSALVYLNAFLPPMVSERYSDFMQDVRLTWRPGEKLNDDALRHLFTINKELRRAYDATSARTFGMKSFDEEFKPILGWEDYYSEHMPRS